MLFFSVCVDDRTCRLQLRSHYSFSSTCPLNNVDILKLRRHGYKLDQTLDWKQSPRPCQSRGHEVSTVSTPILFSDKSSTVPIDPCAQLTNASRLGIELTKIMVLQYSNQETSVTIGESVRDEDGTCCHSMRIDNQLHLGPRPAPFTPEFV